MDRGAWQATVHSVAELDMTEMTEHEQWCEWRLKVHVKIFLKIKLALVITASH